MQITPGKYRHLSQCSSASGHFNVLAIDHRGNLLSSLNQNNGKPLTDAEFIAFKRQIMTHMLPAATAVLTDPDYGFATAFASPKGILAPLEVTDYNLHASRRQTNFIADWSVAKMKRAGASGVKLLLYYHPEADNAARQRSVAERVIAECQKYDIPFFLEPISYSLDPNKLLENDELRQVIVETARTFSQAGIDVLKAEFPVDVTQVSDESVWCAALTELDAACSVPWTILSAGVEYETFKRQAELACQGGASGVIVGRAVWAEAVTLQGAAREEFLKIIAQQRMQELAAICEMYATPWWKKIALPDLAPGWYQSYRD